MDYNVFCEFRHGLANSFLLSDLDDICKRFCKHQSLDYYLFGVCEAISLSSPKVITLTNYPKEWMSEYLERKLIQTDPVVKHCFSSTSAILWSSLGQDGSPLAPEEAEVLAQAKSFGLHDGVSIPARALSGQIAIFSLASSDPGLPSEVLQKVLYSADIFTKYLFDAYLRIDLHENPKVRELTDRELECVFWACEGKTAWEMAQIIGISERTVNFHLTSVIEKLGASNRQHAVAKAILYGLVRPRP